MNEPNRYVKTVRNIAKSSSFSACNMATGDYVLCISILIICRGSTVHTQTITANSLMLRNFILSAMQSTCLKINIILCCNMISRLYCIVAVSVQLWLHNQVLHFS